CGRWPHAGWGATGQFTIVHAEPGVRVLYAWGHVEQKPLPEIQGQAVATLSFSFRPGPDGRTVVATSATGYVQVNNRLLNALGKVAAPFVQAKADKEAGMLLRT